MKIWIDITNSPHVLFFKPLIKEFEKRGYEVTITTRDYAQTIPLLNNYGLKYFLIGKHQGKSVAKKALGFLFRSLQLILFGRRKGFNLAVSHNSNDLALAAFFLRIPHVIMFDYEYASLSHRVNFKLVTKILVPEALPTDVLLKYGADKGKIEKYRGFKEQVYLPFCSFEKDLPKKLGLNPKKVIVTMRTPATMSLYHRFENELFNQILKELSLREDVQIVLLPRTPEQREEYKREYAHLIVIPDGAVDGPSLIFHSDLMIGAGGTMNREAAALGVPVYTVFKGKMGAIDNKLIEQGKLHIINSEVSIKDIKIEKRKKQKIDLETNIEEVAEKILSTPIIATFSGS